MLISEKAQWPQSTSSFSLVLHAYAIEPLRSWRRILQIQVHVHNDYDDKNFSGGSRLAGILHKLGSNMFFHSRFVLITILKIRLSYHERSSTLGLELPRPLTWPLISAGRDSHGSRPWYCAARTLFFAPGADPGFSLGGGGGVGWGRGHKRLCAHHECEAPKSLTAGVQCPLHGLESYMGVWCSLWCDLIQNWDWKKQTYSIKTWGGTPAAPPPWSVNVNAPSPI